MQCFINTHTHTYPLGKGGGGRLLFMGSLFGGISGGTSGEAFCTLMDSLLPLPSIERLLFNLFLFFLMRGGGSGRLVSTNSYTLSSSYDALLQLLTELVVDIRLGDLFAASHFRVWGLGGSGGGVREEVEKWKGGGE